MLPEPQRDYERERTEFEEGLRMPYVTTWERHGMFELIEDMVRAKFGEQGAKLLPDIWAMNDAEKYKALNRAVAAATTLDEVLRACADLAGPAPRGKKGGNGKRGRTKG